VFKSKVSITSLKTDIKQATVNTYISESKQEMRAFIWRMNKKHSGRWTLKIESMYEVQSPHLLGDLTN